MTSWDSFRKYLVWGVFRSDEVEKEIAFHTCNK